MGGTAVETAVARWRSRLTAGLAGAAVAVTALAGLVAVSSGAQPGDPLYGLKRGTEQTQLALAGDSSRGQTLLDFASTRLHELDRLLSGGPTALPAAGDRSGDRSGGDGGVLAAGATPELVMDTLRTMDAQTTQGAAWLATRAAQTGTTSPLDFLTGWTSRQSADLSALVAEVPAGAREAMGSSLALLSRINARDVALRGALTCPAGPATAGSDVLGPVPAECQQAAPSATGGSTPGSGGTASGGPPSTDPPVPGAPAVPTSGGGSGGSVGPTAVPSAPRTTDPSMPAPSLATLPPVQVSRPGSSGGSGASPGSGSSAGTSPPPVGVCLGPIVVGTC
jgi:hypothetical protein